MVPDEAVLLLARIEKSPVTASASGFHFPPGFADITSKQPPKSGGLYLFTYTGKFSVAAL